MLSDFSFNRTLSAKCRPTGKSEAKKLLRKSNQILQHHSNTTVFCAPSRLKMITADIICNKGIC